MVTLVTFRGVGLYRKKCRRCMKLFERVDLVMHAGPLLYHVSCFSCHYCDKKFITGENFFVNNDEIYCGAECIDARPSSTKTEIFVRDDDDCWDSSTLTSLDNQMTTTPPLSLRSPRSDEACETIEIFPKRIATCFFEHHLNVITFPGPSSASVSTGSMKKNKKDKQATRVRTVLNEKQLMTLKTCYAANSRPDAIMKEQLVEMTGLSARVIRVWFQNKRCKDKKRQQALRHLQQRAETASHFDNFF
ncbi:unnamed protein product [Dracunculus medinensis]|uniref:Homeobox domain-containing protein n=1 Tax=Dracunculus medinensis TaxID=318479 RepID=A0A0N4UB20_DRAME|nr:unnamed protein product [Dracunculus medinensis]